MAKKFVRGVTGVDDIEKFDKSLTNVNDIISDGQDTYVHTKKGKTESYYKLTGSLTSLQSNDSGLITVTKDDTNGTVTIHPKHDTQKEQSLESTRSTVTIQKGANGTSETTKVDTNPQKVLEHDNLLTDYGISKTTSGNTTKLGLEYTKASDGFDLNNLETGNIRGERLVNSPDDGQWFFVSSASLAGGNYAVQEAIRVLDTDKTKYKRCKNNGVWGVWREQVGDKSVIDALLAKKQNTLTNNTSIGVSGNTLRQLYALNQTYSHANGSLKTHVKSVSSNTNVSVAEEEFNFTLKINQGSQEATFTLNTHDKGKFNNIITTYGTGNAVRINGCLLSLSGTTLTVSTEANTESNYVITFSDII